MIKVKKALKMVGKAFLVFLVLHSIMVFVLFPWYSKWGMTRAEAAMALPGDEIITADTLLYTRGISIKAPPEKIWPWLVQVGQGRGGMYSYVWLENLIGCKMKNTDKILPEFQDLKVGDYIAYHPKLKTQVTALEPNSHIIFGDGGTSYHLVPQADGTTKLILRGRANYTGFLHVLDRLIFQPGSFLMEQKMLRTIRDLVEAQG